MIAGALIVVIVTPFVAMLVRAYRFAPPREWLDAIVGVIVLGFLFAAFGAWALIGDALLHAQP